MSQISQATQQYIARVLALVDRNPLDIQSSTPQRLRELLQSAPAAALRKRPSPEAWSVGAIVAHLVDAEIATAFRLRKILSEPGSDIPAYDQEKWSLAQGHPDKDPQLSLREFSQLREMNLTLLRKLTPEKWQLFGMHPERGKETIDQIVRLLAGHDINHIGQIERTLQSVNARNS